VKPLPPPAGAGSRRRFAAAFPVFAGGAFLLENRMPARSASAGPPVGKIYALVLGDEINTCPPSPSPKQWYRCRGD